MLRFNTSPNQDRLRDARVEPLWDDMIECERLLEREDSQFARRTFCRTAYAFLEGALCFLRETAIHFVLQKG